MPLDAILADFGRHYPRWIDRLNRPAAAAAIDFQADVARETGTAP